MEFSDRTVKCATCGRDFLFTTKEQEFFVGKGFKEPRHCRECRQQRKHERDEAVAQATGQPLPAGREMFKVICATCQRETLVPFKPITGKPVLCKDCFIAQRYGAPGSAAEAPALQNAIPFIAGAAQERIRTGVTLSASQVHIGSEVMPLETNLKSAPELSLSEVE
jgi:CxxC-x17-CxxC domain-containing protein